MRPDYITELADGMITGDGQRARLTSNITRTSAEQLVAAVKHTKPAHALEIGMAYGLSSLYILEALDDEPGTELVSVDPFQEAEWKSLGVANVRRFGFADKHRMIQASDYLVLPEMVSRGERFQFAYVDGSHAFDHVLLDLFYIDLLLEVNGIVGLNDVHLLSVRKAIRYLITHRHYKEVRFGWEPQYAARLRTARAVRRTLDWQTQDRYFRKVDDWRPSWNHYSRVIGYLRMQVRNRRSSRAD